jgi:hypothetical protein
MVGVKGGAGDIVATFRRFGLDAVPASNPVCSMMVDAERLEVTTGGCSCALYSDDPPDVPSGYEKMRRGYERKGWSKAKIDRAIEASRLAAARPSSKPDKAVDFVAAIKELADGRARIFLLAHDFRGLFTEPFPIAGKASMTIDDYVTGGGKFPADTLVTLVD